MKPLTLGWHEPVARYGQRLGAIVQAEQWWVPVCMHKTCQRRLHFRRTSDEARDGLRAHWDDKHTPKRAAA